MFALRTLAVVRLGLGLATAVAFAGCGSDDPKPTESEDDRNKKGDGGTTIRPLEDAGVRPACTATSVKGTTTRRPVDVVVVADTSNSMGNAVAAVQQNINVNFAQILLQSGVDFRVILLADVASMCIAPPLGGAACGQATLQFFPVDLPTGSGNGLSAPIAGYAMWSPHLRPEAFKVILQLSDTTTTSTMSAAEYDAALLAMNPPQFGTPTDRGYVYHGILGLPTKVPVTDPWLATDPVLTGGCNGNGLSGAAQPAYQQLAILTGGLRYPLCEPSHYDVVFKQVASSVITKAELPCSLAKPTTSGGPLDESTLVVRYTPSGTGGVVQSFAQVPNAGACRAGAFYVTATTLELCPQTCTSVRANEGATLDVEYGCPPAIQ